MKKINILISILLIIVVSPVQGLTENRVTDIIIKSEYFTKLLCDNLKLDIELAAIDIKSSKQDIQFFHQSSAVTPKENTKKKLELLNSIKEFKEEIIKNTHHLSNLLNIYSRMSCNMSEIAESIYCPDGWDKSCKIK